MKKNNKKNKVIFKLLDYHIDQKNDFTIVAAFKKIVTPYGVCKINKKQNSI